MSRQYGGRGRRGKKAKKKQEQVIEEEPDEVSEGIGEDYTNQGQDRQLQLTQEEKEEVIPKSLNDKNPQAPHNVTEFSYKERVFKKNELVE